MDFTNTALWLAKPSRNFHTADAPYTPPAESEIVVRTRAVSLNFIDDLPGVAYRVILPWLKFPAILGTDVAGEVVEVGSGVTRLAVGDRVIGHAFGLEKSQNRPAEGAFQNYVVLMERMVSPIPDSLSFEQASVLPLQLSTASVGLFEQDQLGLALPTANPVERNETVIVWGGSTGVGSNGIQLARNAGYRVLATASPKNFDYVRSLGAVGVADYNSPTAVDELVALVGESPLAGILAIGRGSLRAASRISARSPGTRKISAAQPGILTRLQSMGPRARRLKISAIWGGSLKDNEVGPGIYVDFLPGALASGAYAAAPPAEVVGHGLDAIPAALETLRGGVSAKKLVVTI